jgi:glutathione S-transferase
MMKLYGTPFSNNVRRAYAVALHVGAQIELVEVLPRTPAVNTPEFRAVSPGGRVPALSDGNFSTDESHAIMLYLAEIKPNTLWPGDRVRRAQVMRWMSWALAHWRLGWQPLQFERFIKPVFLKGQTDDVAVAQALPIFHAEAKTLDQHLADRPWLVGGELTLADFSVAAGLCYATQAQFPLEGYAHIRNWYQRVEALPAWQKSAPRPPASAST